MADYNEVLSGPQWSSLEWLSPVFPVYATCRMRLTLRSRTVAVIVMACLLAISKARADRAGLLTTHVDAGASSPGSQWRHATFGKPTEPVVRRSSLQVNWRDLPLRDAVERLESATGVVVFLDRRIDPDSPISIDAKGSAFALLKTVGEQIRCGVSTLAGVYYVGPEDVAIQLRTLHARSHARTKNLPRTVSKHFHRRAELSWPQRTSPREIALLSELLAADQRLRIPHDLWRAQRLPVASRSEQLTLLLAGFDLDWRPTVDGRHIEVEPIAEPVTLTAWHPQTDAGGWRPTAFLERAVGAQLTKRGDGWLLRGRYEDHLLLANGPATARKDRNASPESSSAPLDSHRFTLEVKGTPASAILGRVATALKLDFTDRTRRGETDRPISIAVENASIKQFFSAISEAAGMHLVVEGDRLIATSPDVGE